MLVIQGGGSAVIFQVLIITSRVGHIITRGDAGGDRSALVGGRDGADVAVLHLGQDEHRAKAEVGIILGREVVGDIEAEAAAHGHTPAEPQVGDVAPF